MKSKLVKRSIFILIIIVAMSDAIFILMILLRIYCYSLDKYKNEKKKI